MQRQRALVEWQAPQLAGLAQKNQIRQFCGASNDEAMLKLLTRQEGGWIAACDPFPVIFTTSVDRIGNTVLFMLNGKPVHEWLSCHRQNQIQCRQSRTCDVNLDLARCQRLQGRQVDSRAAASRQRA